MTRTPRFTLAAAILLAAALLAAAQAQNDAIRPAITAAVDHPARPQADRDRDADRKPAQTLAFFQIRPGQHVADLMAGAGYFTQILAHAVGPQGKVYAQNNAVSGRKNNPRLAERVAAAKLPNVQVLQAELEAPGLPAGSLDAVLMVQFYHDTYWMNTDRPAMNRAIFSALKPGGVYGIIDHSAQPGQADKQVKTLHRVEADLVKKEILAAGFILEAESDLLRNLEDDRTLSVFDKSIRGHTDQFALRFRKPAN